LVAVPRGGSLHCWGGLGEAERGKMNRGKNTNVQRKEFEGKKMLKLKSDGGGEKSL